MIKTLKTDKPMYYNTTNQKKSALELYKSKALSQTQIIEEVMRRRGKMTPSKMWLSLRNNELKWPLTSVRRSLTSLMKDGVLEKGDFETGLYGRPEHTYVYKNGN